jgi:hypothetical protein
MPPKIQTMVRRSSLYTAIHVFNSPELLLTKNLFIRTTLRSRALLTPTARSPCSLPPPPPPSRASSRFLCEFRYVGGGNSGGGVSANVIDESLLADKIKAQGGKTIEDYEREQAEKKKPKPFSGAGNSIRGGTVAAEQAPPEPTENHHTIHLWRNGIRCCQPSPACAVLCRRLNLDICHIPPNTPL